MTDIVLEPAGKTVDGKPLYNVEQIVPDPELIVSGARGDKHNTSNTVKDEFGINRPKRLPWLEAVYGRASNSCKEAN